MCGISGFLGFGVDNVTTLLNMVTAIEHRGPDALNQWVDDSHQIALGHARLSVVDLSKAGSQPMTSASARYVVSYNGEIYNHLEIRNELNLAHEEPRWRGTSDTETLLAAFDAWGIDISLQKCIGMFAMAVWDKSNQTLTLIRDRFGEKPLYYMPTGKGVVFASELSGLKQHPDCSQVVSQSAVKYLSESSCIPAPLSIFEGVFKLLPGTHISFNCRGFLSTRQWWSPFETATKNYSGWEGSEADALVELEKKLGECVQRQMLADVPLGAFLSGGIDSSLIAALMQEHSDKPVKTYTIGFNQREFDEAQYAHRVAQYLGTDHTEHYITEKEVLDTIPHLGTTYSEPFADSSQLPMFLVSKLARQDVTVALSGDAGDEIFAGYSRHMFTHNQWSKLKKIPHPVRKLAASLIQLPTESQLDRVFGILPMTSEWTRIGEKLHRSGYALSAKSLKELHQFLTRTEVSDHVLGVPVGSADVVGPQSELLVSMNSSIDESINLLDPMRWMMAKDQSDYLPNDILVKVDQAAMANSLETRAPFLDHTLVEFAQKLPSSMLLDGKKGKKPLRSILGKRIPAELFERPKMGFSIPIHDLIRGPLREWAHCHLTESAIQRTGAFDAGLVAKLWQEHIAGKRNNIMKLWPILVYQAWEEASK